MIKELKNFLFRGNVLDLAVAVIIGGAFGKIVAGFIEYIIMPAIGAIVGQPNFSAITLGALQVGSFVNVVLDFVIIGTVLFFVIKAAEKAMPKKPEVTGPTQEEILLEIRDLLKEKN